MITLAIRTEPYWLDLKSGVRLFVRPLTTMEYETARRKGLRLAAEVMKDFVEVKATGGTVEGLGDLEDPDVQGSLSQLKFTQALAIAAVIRWEGVGTGDGDEVAEVCEANVKTLMLMPGVADDFLVEYTQPVAELEREGNG